MSRIHAIRTARDITGMDLHGSKDLVERIERDLAIGSPMSPAPEGLTVRDAFAMAALTGLVSGGTQGDPIPSFGELAYRLADAMLMAREALAQRPLNHEE